MKLNTRSWIAAATIIAASLSAAAHAVPAQWTDTVSFTPTILMTPFKPVIYTHTLEGFTPGVDYASSYSISFNLYDDGNDGAYEGEKALFSQPGNWFDSEYFDLSGIESGGWTLQGRWQINSSGSLTVAITSLLGDFYLGGSTLTVRGEKNAVPEPGTLALFGAALLGFGLMRRKRVAV